jgi:hypothetical protein
MYERNVAQCGDALALLKSLSDRCTPLVFLIPNIAPCIPEHDI